MVPTDVTDLESVQRLAERAAAEFGRIDAWVNNAAVSAVGLFDEIPVAEFRRVLEVNLLGAVHGIKAALPHLGAAGGGVLVNNASVLAEVAMPYQSAYNATKHGIRGLADTVRQELRVTGRGHISVCTVLPATIDTPFFRHAANHTGRELMPPPPIYPPEVVAETIVRLLRRPRREAYAGGAARLIGLQWRLAPGAGRAHPRLVRRSAPSSARALGWTAAATCFHADAEARRDGGWHGRRRSVGADDRRVRSGRRRHRCRHRGGDQPPLPVGPLMADVDRPNARPATGVHNGAIMSNAVSWRSTSRQRWSG